MDFVPGTHDREWAGKRVFITGATGFIGGALARRLHAGGATVVGLARSQARGTLLEKSGVTVAYGDIVDRNALTRHLEAASPQVVVHMAAWLGGRDASEAIPVNVDATAHLARVCAGLGIDRFVHCSSIAVYGPHGDRPVDERYPLELYGDPYGDSKILSEIEVQTVCAETGLRSVVIRPGMVYGPGSRGWTKRVAIWAKRGWTPLINGGKGSAHPIYIENLCDLILLAGINPTATGETFNAVDDQPQTFAAFFAPYMAMIPTNRALRLPGAVVRIIAALANPFVTVNLPWIASELSGTGRVSNQKAKDLLGWSPRVSPAEAMQASEEWLRSQQIL